MFKQKILPAVILVLILFLCQTIFAEEGAKKNKTIIPGFIFNTESIFIDLESYQAGIGLKMRDFIYNEKIKCNLRSLLFLSFNHFFNDYSVKFGLAAEFPLIRDQRLVPYWGLFADVEYSYLFVETSETTSIAETRIPVSFGGMVGAELFLIEYVSLFAEYNLVGYLLNTIIEVTDPAIPEEEAGATSSMDFKLRTEIGNKGMIGIVIYFKPVKFKKK